jgi:hypothetical protein
MTPTGPITLLKQRHPRLGWIASPWVIVGCLGIAAAVAHLAVLPTTPTMPSGLELELPGTADGALGILRALDDAGLRGQAANAIGYDFLLIWSYSIGLAALIEWLAARDPAHADALVPYAAWGAILAGLCDIGENSAMLTLLHLYPDTSHLGLVALLGTLASLTKWTLVFAVVGYAAWEVAKSIVRTLRRPRSGPVSRDPVDVSPGGASGEPAVNAPAQSPYEVPVFVTPEEVPLEVAQPAEGASSRGTATLARS